jgi:hypothetical protein
LTDADDSSTAVLAATERLFKRDDGHRHLRAAQRPGRLGCEREIRLAEAKGGPEHIARLVWYVTDIAEYRASAKPLGAVWRAVMGRNFPAMSVVGVSALVEPHAVVEIEAAAILPG